MTQRRPIIAAAFVLATLGAGIAASGVAQAGRVPAPRISTTTKAPNKIPICYAGPNCQRTKNAALPTTTKPKTVTTPMPTIKPRTKNAALAPTTTVKKKGNPHATTPPSITTSSKPS